jgi:hypothetical protein
MSTNRKVRMKKRRVATAATFSLIATLSEDGNLETIIRLAIRLGDVPFGELTEDKAGVAEGIAILHRLWPLHRAAAVARCIRRYGLGSRPALWWTYDSPAPRPPVRQRDWSDPSDRARYARERAAVDLVFLKTHKLLTAKERGMITEATIKKRFGPPQADDENT